jgi:hypothetical protein
LGTAPRPYSIAKVRGGFSPETASVVAKIKIVSRLVRLAPVAP